METELRQLILSKCKAKGIQLIHLTQATDCSVTELKGFEQGVIILSSENIARLLLALNIADEELISAIGPEAASEFIQKRNSSSA